MALRSMVNQTGAWAAEALPEELEYAIVESAAEIRFVDFSRERAKWLGYPQGVAFGRAGELRWMARAGGGVDAVYVSDAGRALAGSTRTQEMTLIGQEGLPRHVFLRGREDGGAVREGRIPGDLEYPFAVAAGQLPVVLLAYYETIPAGPTPYVRLVAPSSVPDFAEEEAGR